MKIKKAISVFIVSIAVIAALLSITGRATQAQGSVASDTAVLAKLNEIVSNQKLIIAGLDSLKAELNIVKIRVTQSQ